MSPTKAHVAQNAPHGLLTRFYAEPTPCHNQPPPEGCSCWSEEPRRTRRTASVSDEPYALKAALPIRRPPPIMAYRVGSQISLTPRVLLNGIRRPYRSRRTEMVFTDEPYALRLLISIRRWPSNTAYPVGTLMSLMPLMSICPGGCSSRSENQLRTRHTVSVLL